jgi:hypothetical protein
MPAAQQDERQRRRRMDGARHREEMQPPDLSVSRDDDADRGQPKSWLDPSTLAKKKLDVRDKNLALLMLEYPFTLFIQKNKLI